MSIRMIVKTQIAYSSSIRTLEACQRTMHTRSRLTHTLIPCTRTLPPFRSLVTNVNIGSDIERRLGQSFVGIKDYAQTRVSRVQSPICASDCLARGYATVSDDAGGGSDDKPVGSTSASDAAIPKVHDVVPDKHLRVITKCRQAIVSDRTGSLCQLWAPPEWSELSIHIIL